MDDNDVVELVDDAFNIMKELNLYELYGLKPKMVVKYLNEDHTMVAIKAAYLRQYPGLRRWVNA